MAHLNVLRSKSYAFSGEGDVDRFLQEVQPDSTDSCNHDKSNARGNKTAHSGPPLKVLG